VYQYLYNNLQGLHAESYNGRLQQTESYEASYSASNPGANLNTPTALLFVSCPNWGLNPGNLNAYDICPHASQTNDNGDLQAYDEYVGGPGASALQNFHDTFGYDHLNRLTSATDTGGWARTFGYDQWGNMWVTTPAATAVPTLNVNTAATNLYNANNQRTDQSYDAAGNLSGLAAALNLGFTYDAENRQTAAGLYTYAYDGDGRRVQKTGGGATTVYVYDAAGQLAAEYSTAAAAAPSPCATCYLSYDHLGSVRMVTDSHGNVISRHDYLPFGEEIPGNTAGRGSVWGAAGDTVSQRFTGKERDSESGLDHFGARYYGSGMGRWTSPDWSERAEPVPYADFSNPQSLNLYAYIRNNPLAQSDPDGHCPPCLFTLVPDQRTMDVWKGVGKGWVNMHLKNDTALGGVFKALGVQTQVASNADQAAGMAASPIVQEGVSLAAGFMGPKGEEPVGPGEGNAITPEAGIATPKVDAIAGEIERGGYQVTPNEKTATQEGNVTITHPDQPGVKLNLRIETHPLEPGGAPVRHVNVETVTPRTGKTPKQVDNHHITQ